MKAFPTLKRLYLHEGKKCVGASFRTIKLQHREFLKIYEISPSTVSGGIYYSFGSRGDFTATIAMRLVSIERYINSKLISWIDSKMM